MSNVSTSKPASASSNDKPGPSAPAKPVGANGASASVADTKPPTIAANTSPALAPASPAPGPENAPEGDDEKEKIQYHVILGKVETFPDVSKAEAFLNAPEAPQCMVIYGKTSLVNEWHITTGTIRSFPSLIKAQKFLKETAGSDKFVMVRGRITQPEVRVSLRR